LPAFPPAFGASGSVAATKAARFKSLHLKPLFG
jgi:hypothetical protein